MQAAAETVLCWNLIRIDLHWPASSSSPTLSLCSFSHLALFYCEIQMSISFSATTPQISLITPCFTCFYLSFLYLYVCMYVHFSFVFVPFNLFYSVLILHCVIMALLYAAPGEPANAD